jgi:dsDNA-specific endonuclease/ATPase MutS2
MPGVPKELIEHSLNVDNEATPKKQCLRRFAQDKRDAIKKEIENYSQQGSSKSQSG